MRANGVIDSAAPSGDWSVLSKLYFIGICIESDKLSLLLHITIGAMRKGPYH